jgi:deferrochelatase/peroxidase EfeB
MIEMGAPLLTDVERTDIQGFVLSGYGHLPAAAYLFPQINDPDGARRWLASILPSVATAAPWPTGADGRTAKPASTLNVAFTAAGLRALGLPERVVHTFAPEFQEGMSHPERARILGDTAASAPEHWELGGLAQPEVHALLFAHASSEEALDTFVARLREGMEQTRAAVGELPGSLQRGVIPDGHDEPFGFRDGMGQPSIVGMDGHGVPTGEFVLGHLNHYGLIAPGPVIPSSLDPQGLLPPLANPHHASGGWHDLGRNGTYVVYRKLEQDVAGFWRFMKEEARRWGKATDVEAMVRLASRCVGRWPGGAPLVLRPDAPDAVLDHEDNFLYATSDPHGLACPLGAHIRRTNPRDDLKPYPPQQSLSMSEAHRLLRRGRVFGPPLFDPQVLAAPDHPAAHRLLALEDDGQARGIHFVCVNASIASQFEFVQQAWCNSPHFLGLHDNPDPLVGGHDDPEHPAHMSLPQSNGGLERTAPLTRFVTVRGGAYLFMPGMAALGFLAGMAR